MLIVNCKCFNCFFMVNFPNNSWNPFFEKANNMGLFNPIVENLLVEKQNNAIVFPPSHQIFRAFELCDLKDLKVVIVGQDPYHGENEANGLSFSVHKGVKIPPSLRNIFKELKIEYPEFNLNRDTDLSDWADLGVLLLNSVLTVRKDLAASHSTYGWQYFTDYIIKTISDQRDFVVFILWGNYAKSKSVLIDTKKHKILTSVHPSPLSASRGFFNSNIFKSCNAFLEEKGKQPIIW